MLRLFAALTVIAGAYAVFLEWRFAELRRIDAAYELYPMPQALDVDGDSTAGTVSVEQTGSSNWPRRLLVEDGGRRLLTLPYCHADGTFRTHLAARRDTTRMRLVVYDGACGSPNVVRDAYAWNGHALVRDAPDTQDELLLTAMAAVDDTGTFHDWLWWWISSKLIAVAFAAGWLISWMWARRFDNRHNKRLQPAAASVNMSRHG